MAGLGNMANLNKYIGDLPANVSLDGTELFEIQKGASGLAGSSQNLTLTNLATKIGALIASLFATAAQGAEADAAVKSVNSTDTNITVNNTDPKNPTLALGAGVAEYAKQGTFTKSQQVTPVVNAAATGTITPDCSVSNTFEYTVTGALTIANPANTTPGQFVNFLIIENATGGYTITLGTKFKIMNTTSFITAANTANMLSGYVASNGNIYCNISQ